LKAPAICPFVRRRRGGADANDVIYAVWFHMAGQMASDDDFWNPPVDRPPGPVGEAARASAARSLAEGTASPEARLASAYPAGQPGQLVERNFWLWLVLVVITLGIATYFYHYATHDELNRQLGRRNEERRLFWAWVGTSVVTGVVFMLVVVAFVGAIATAAATLSQAEIISILVGLGAIFVLAIIGAVASFALYMMFTFKQFELWQRARGNLPLPTRPGFTWFVSWLVGGQIAAWLGLPVTLITSPIAYWHLVEGYNELARSYASDARRDDTAPAALA